MEKGKINSVKNEDYGEGRVDIFDLEEIPDIHQNFIAFVSTLGFKNRKNLSKFDTDFSLFDGVIFTYKGDIRITLVWEESKKLIVDSKKIKEEIINILERYFKIF
ncbi:MAG: hypothetical protein WDZ62_01465 [Candidatus Pacearchaeota archaeon]